MVSERESPALEGPPIREEERGRLLSSARLRLKLIVFFFVLLACVSAMIFALVTELFDHLTPVLREDLRWKARTLALELAHHAELAVLTEDRVSADAAVAEYRGQVDIRGIVVEGGSGKRLSSFGVGETGYGRLFAHAPNAVHEVEGQFLFWSEVSIEGRPVGRVGVLLSGESLETGARLKRRIVLTGVLGSVAALVLSLVFVQFYIGPIIRVTRDVLDRLEQTTLAAVEATRAKSELARTLELRVEERTSELRTANTRLNESLAELKSTQSQLVEASRLAGKAEVATGIVHNLGNVLNSVNISVTMLETKVRKSRAENLVKTASLLRDHGARLGEFVTGDERGRRLPEYLTLLSDALVREQGELRQEIERLATNVEHAKTIVSVQQKDASALIGVVEDVAVEEMVEEALRLSALSSRGGGELEMVRDYGTPATVLVDKHLVLEILVNMVTNASHALAESGRGDKRIVLRTKIAEDRAVIEVEDNGVGIASENRTRIFNHGFTTRKDGHGFGLHRSAILADQIGGSLTCESEGAGRGARFILEFPTSPRGPLSSRFAGEIR